MSNDWEDLLNGVFGSGGKLNFSDAAGKENAKKAKEALEAQQKRMEEMLARQRDASAANKQVSGEQLLQNSNALDEQIKAQAAEISQMSQSLTQNLQNDGLISAAQAESARPVLEGPKTGELFREVQAESEELLVGQKSYIQSLVGAFRRPFVMGHEGNSARNVMLICGPEGSGRHHVMLTLVELLAQKRLLAGPNIAWMDLSLYSGPAQEKLFLQDMYAALEAPGSVIAFENIGECHAANLSLLARLAIDGKAPLASRYVVQKGLLMDAGNALAPDAVSSLSAKGKYLVFFAGKGPEKMAGLLGVKFMNAVGDVCTSQPFSADELRTLAARGFNRIAAQAKQRLGFKILLEKQPEGSDVIALAVEHAKGKAGRLTHYCDRCFAALAEYTLRCDPAADSALTLSRSDAHTLIITPEGGEAIDLLALLPKEYSADVDEVKAEFETIVGLAEIKDYVLGLEDNIIVQRRRAEAGMKTANLSMHMIFTGNPGTGKTTIARLVGKYLKAIGALSSGQLVEVSRADLVGRYVGHTAPLTNQVIQSALGGVLFIDEAYSLCRGQDDSFGLEAIDTLVKGMEDNREDLVVILAGYSKEMADFLESNSGLRSRFPNHIEFPDYTADELLAITKLNAKSRGYVLADGCDAPLCEFYAKAQIEDAAKNGNGRMARNELEEAILNQSRRLIVQPEAAMDLLLPSDFDL